MKKIKFPLIFFKFDCIFVSVLFPQIPLSIEHRHFLYCGTIYISLISWICISRNSNEWRYTLTFSHVYLCWSLIFCLLASFMVFLGWKNGIKSSKKKTPLYKSLQEIRKKSVCWVILFWVACVVANILFPSHHLGS